MTSSQVGKTLFTSPFQADDQTTYDRLLLLYSNSMENITFLSSGLGDYRNSRALISRRLR